MQQKASETVETTSVETGLTPEDYEIERTEILFSAISRLKARPEEIVGTLMREFMKRREAIQERRRQWVDDNMTWSRLSQQIIELDSEITKLRGAEKEIFDSIFEQGGGKAHLFEGRRGIK
jgi:hypothetical protein